MSATSTPPTRSNGKLVPYTRPAPGRAYAIQLGSEYTMGPGAPYSVRPAAEYAVRATEFNLPLEQRIIKDVPLEQRIIKAHTPKSAKIIVSTKTRRRLCSFTYFFWSFIIGLLLIHSDPLHSGAWRTIFAGFYLIGRILCNALILIVRIIVLVAKDVSGIKKMQGMEMCAANANLLA
ncbi:hypothetical protein FRC08_014825 [Ceratobasidium sp. 394]|nr:hypothetical protein FRC08_014825 [Ceratobasidium sp. 394]KAG9094075.1 hypothetical protein FS749_013185 [Ceratobasidium sp. UAMH 11750]